MTATAATTIHLLAAMLSIGDDPCELPRIERSQLAQSLLDLVLELTPEAAALLPADAVERTRTEET